MYQKTASHLIPTISEVLSTTKKGGRESGWLYIHVVTEKTFPL
jgi:hypothetical protein